jgi:predicted nucleic acid-binding protein
MKIFVDTNLFVYAVDALSPFHHDAGSFFESVAERNLEPHYSNQVLGEFFSAVTKRAARPLSPTVAAREALRMLQATQLVRLPIDDIAMKLTLALAGKHGLRGVEIFDAQIVGTMLSHGVEVLYTANVRDFARFDEIDVVNPLLPAGPGTPRVAEKRRRYRR